MSMTDDVIEQYDENDVGLEAEDKAEIGSNRQEWLKMTKGQVILCSFVYFHTVEVNAMKAVKAAAKKAGKPATPDELRAAAAKALVERTKVLAEQTKTERTPDKVEPYERLDLSVVQFKRFKAHYQQGFGFALSRLGMDGAEADSVWRKLPESKQYFSTLLMVYPMTREGKHDIESIKAGNWRLIPWRFGPGTYDEIWNLNDGLRGNGMSIANQDLKLECKDTTYQNMKVQFVGKTLWQQHAGLKKLVLTKALEQYDKLIPFRAMTTDQLRAKLGIGGSPVGDVASNEDFSGLLDNV